MPVIKCSNGKYRIGSGECIYDTEEKALQVWKAILASGLYGKANNKQQSNLREKEGGQSSEEQKQKQS
jgi:CRISPR/Cas system-associated endonuclease Cas1